MGEGLFDQTESIHPASKARMRDLLSGGAGQGVQGASAARGY